MGPRFYSGVMCGRPPQEAPPMTPPAHGHSGAQGPDAASKGPAVTCHTLKTPQRPPTDHQGHPRMMTMNEFHDDDTILYGDSRSEG